MGVGLLVRAEASVFLLDVVDVSGVEIFSCESLEDGAVVGERVDGLGLWPVPESPSQGRDPDGVGQVIERNPLPAEIVGKSPVAARWS